MMSDEESNREGVAIDGYLSFRIRSTE